MEKELVYLDSYVLQNDMRLRLPKAVLLNLPVEKGKTVFDIYLDTANTVIVLRIKELPDASGV